MCSRQSKAANTAVSFETQPRSHGEQGLLPGADAHARGLGPGILIDLQLVPFAGAGKEVGKGMKCLATLCSQQVRSVQVQPG